MARSKAVAGPSRASTASAGKRSGEENASASQEQVKKRKLSVRLSRPLVRVDQNRIPDIAGAYEEEEDDDNDDDQDDQEHEDEAELNEENQDEERTEDDLFSKDDLQDIKVKVELPAKVKKEPASSIKKAGNRKQGPRGGGKSNAEEDAWMPVDFGIRVFAAGDPKAKTVKDKKARQLGAQRVVKLTTPTSYKVFKTMLKELVQNDPSEESISGDIENWNISVLLNANGSIYSQRTALKNEDVYTSFIEELQASTKRSATIFVEEKMRLKDAQPLPSHDPPQLQAVDSLKYAYPAVQEFDKQILRRWLCNDKTCSQRSKIAPSCYVNPRRPSVHINLKSSHRFHWASALADGAQGVTIEIPPATAEFLGHSDVAGTPIVVEDGELKAKGENGATSPILKRAETKPRRKALSPVKNKEILDEEVGMSAGQAIDVDQYSSDIEPGVIVKKENEDAAATKKLKGKGKKKAGVAFSSSLSSSSVPSFPDGPEMQLEEFIKSCLVRDKLAQILRDADYGMVDELIQLEKDAAAQEQLGIVSALLHQFKAAMTRWRKMSTIDTTASSSSAAAGPSSESGNAPGKDPSAIMASIQTATGAPASAASAST
ncbi:hypothetical protein OC834_007229 [Tilletia horrida]|nr:hypothetical protein OC834_007229 [Tilletia horrida]